MSRSTKNVKKEKKEKKYKNLPEYPADRDDDLRNEHGAVPIPKGFFVKQSGNVFQDEIEENHALEQFFWTEETVRKICGALEYRYIEDVCCLMTPSMAHEWHQQGRDEVLLDIDERFDYLPKFGYYDVTKPTEVDDEFRMIILDPPFFLIPPEQIRKAVDVITGGDTSIKLIIAYIIRGEKALRKAFDEFDLKPTGFELQYSSIKPNKWRNFCLYSNIDLPGIKRRKD
jgi:Probable N6-adenine methyltransferase